MRTQDIAVSVLVRLVHDGSTLGKHESTHDIDVDIPENFMRLMKELRDMDADVEVHISAEMHGVRIVVN